MAIRVIHMGTGFTGKSALEGILADPALELVGWYVSSPEKEGLDAGEFCGVQAVGVKATRDFDAFLSLDADCVCYASDVIGREEEAVREMASFLERGIDVATFAIVSMVYPPAGPPLFREIIDTACRKGGTTFYCSGTEPGLYSMSLPAALLSGAGEVKSYREQQFVLDMISVYGIPEVVRESMGFGKPAGSIPRRFIDGTCAKWWEPNITCIADLMGTKVDRIDFRYETAMTDKDINTRIGVFKSGTVGAYFWQLEGVVNGKPAISVDYVCCLTPEVSMPAHWPRPAPDSKDAAIVYLIEGRPSYKNQIYVPTPADSMVNACVPMTAMHVVNAIPAVVAAKPGMVCALDLPYYGPRNISFG